MADLVGQQFGNYRLTQQLGQGGFADVYLGEHIHLATQAAIKILHNRFLAEDLDIVRQEAQIIARLRHPNIIHVFDFGINANGIPFLAMDYLPLGNILSAYPRGQLVPLQRVISFTKHVALALQHAHDAGIIHCDVKPENLLMGPHQEVILSDFGIAVMAHRTASMEIQRVIGTARYMAPEQFRGRPEKASDQYALGIVTYEWLCGTVPFSKGDFLQLGYQHTYEPVPLLRNHLPTLSAHVEAVLMRSLAKQPQDRFPSVQAFAHALEEAARVSPPGTRLLTYRGHGDGYCACAWSPDGRLFATGGVSGLIQMWDVTTGKLITTHDEGNTSAVRAMIWSPDGSQLASCSRDLTVQVWRVSRGRLLLTYSCHSKAVDTVHTIAWSPDGSQLAIANGEKIVVWNPFTGANVVTYSGHSAKVDAVAWSPDGSRLASVSGNHTLHVWDANSGQSFSSIQSLRDAYEHVIAWSPDGTRLASAGSLGLVQVWDVSSGQLFHTYGSDYELTKSLAWSPDGTRLAFAGRRVQIWEVNSGQQMYAFPDGYTVRAIAWSPDGTQLAFIRHSEPTVEVWKTGSAHLYGRVLHTHRGSSEEVHGVAWSPDGTRLASTNDSGIVQVWDASSGQLLCTHRSCFFRRGVGLAWSPDGSRLASAHAKTIEIWDPFTGVNIIAWKSTLTLSSTYSSGSPDITLHVRTVVWSPDGSRLASISLFSRIVEVWEASSGRLLFTYSGHSAMVEAVAWSSDGSRLASGSQDDTLHVWDANDGQLLYTLNHLAIVHQVAWSPDGIKIASASNHTLRVWDANSRQLLDAHSYSGDYVNHMAWSSDNTRLAFSLEDTKTVQIWEVGSTRPPLTYQGHSDEVSMIAWSPDGTRLASASDDRTVQIWQAL